MKVSSIEKNSRVHSMETGPQDISEQYDYAIYLMERMQNQEIFETAQLLR